MIRSLLYDDKFLRMNFECDDDDDDNDNDKDDSDHNDK